LTRSHTQDHHGSHRGLLWSHDDSSWGRVDAIVVPTVRPPAHLEHAADLAVRLNCRLVTLHSGRWTNAAAASSRLRPDVSLLAIDVPHPSTLRLPDFATSRLLGHTRFVRRADTSAKRNLALMLSRLVGWRRIVFLDDDIFVSDSDDLRRAAGLLDDYNAVGLSVGGFPDNSVVCHAYREAGGDQQSFIGGGALAVELSREHSFFPDIYNEDWFYLLDAEKGLRQLGLIGQVRQQVYDPFRTPDRARAEELGDVLAEGMFWLLDQSRSIADADVAHWETFLLHRERFIDQVLGMVHGAVAIEPGERVRMVAALKAARGRLALITPGLCQGYLKALAADQERWRRHIRRLGRPQPLALALKALTRPAAPPLTYHLRDGAQAVPAPVESGRTASLLV
jgi:hypothetical protein